LKFDRLFLFDVEERVIITHSPGSVTALRTIDQSRVRRIGKFDLSHPCDPLTKLYKRRRCLPARKKYPDLFRISCSHMCMCEFSHHPFGYCYFFGRSVVAYSARGLYGRAVRQKRVFADCFLSCSDE